MSQSSATGPEETRPNIAPFYRVEGWGEDEGEGRENELQCFNFFQNEHFSKSPFYTIFSVLSNSEQ